MAAATTLALTASLLEPTKSLDRLSLLLRRGWCFVDTK
jgi:hypothetical protein